MTSVLWILIIAVVLDILDREFVELRRYLEKKRIQRSIRTSELAIETRRGNDNAILERLNDVKYKGKTTEEQKGALETEIPVH